MSMIVSTTMSEKNTNENHPSLPANYVSILHLQEQWLKRKQKEQEEKAKLKQIEWETEQEIAAKKQIRQFQQHQRLGNGVGKSGYVEKSNLGRFQGSDRCGHTQRRPYNLNQENGVYKDKGKGKVGEVGENRVEDSVLHRREERGNIERCDGKFKGTGFGGGVVMSLRVVAVEEDEIVEVNKRDDVFRYGLMNTVGDLCKNYDVSESLGKGETVVETKEGLERQKKVDDRAMRVGHKKSGLFRPSRVNNCARLVNIEGSDNLGRREGVEETEEVLEGKANAGFTDVGVAIEVRNVERRSKWGYKKNLNKGLSRSESGRGTEQGQGNGRHMGEQNGIQLDLKKENGRKNVEERSGDNIGDGDGEDVADTGVAVEERNVESMSGRQYKKNRNKKSLPRSELGRGTEQGQGNGRDMGEENGIQLDLKKEIGGKNGEGSLDNIGDGEDVSDMGVRIEIMNVEQRSKGRCKKGLSRSEFERGTEQGKGNGRGVGVEKGIQLDLKKKNGEINGEERSGDNIGDDEDVPEKVARLKVWKHHRVSVGRRNVNERVMNNTRWGYQEWVVKGAPEGAKIMKNSVGEKSSTNYSLVEIPVVSKINEKSDLYSDGSQRNYLDSMVNGEFEDNIMEKKENQKQELFGEHEVKGLLMTNEANGKSTRNRGETKGNWEGERFLREKIRRDFKEFSLNIQRVGIGRKNAQMYGQNRRLQNDQWSGDKQGNSGLVWVKKGHIADADVSKT